jgi:hypothetical protein
VSRTLAFEFRVPLLEVFELDVLEILRELAFYATNDRPEINNTTRINETEYKTE